MPVSTVNKEYEQYADDWAFMRNIIDDNCRGDIHGLDFIPPGLDYSVNPEYRKALYRTQLYRAIGDLLPVTERTIHGLVGLAAAKESNFDLPKELDYLLDDCTGTGIGLEQFKDELLTEIEMMGRVGVLVDYPVTPKTFSKKENEINKVLPRFYTYTPENITGWKTDTVYGSEILTQIRLRECVVKQDPHDEFLEIEEVQYRVLRLRQEGNIRKCTVQVYDKDSKPTGEEIDIRGFDGKPINRIEFFIFGAVKNGVKVNKPPLLQLAKLNFSHLRNSCAHQWYVRLAGSGTLMFGSDFTDDQFKSVNGDRDVYLGSGEGYNLGIQGWATLLQAPDTNAHLESMRNLQDQMLMIGADMITPTTPNQTAYAVKINSAAKISPFVQTIMNVEVGIKALIDMCGDFVKTNLADLKVDLNKDIIPDDADVQKIATELTGIDLKVTSIKRVRDNWRHKYGMIPVDMTDKELDDEIAAEEHLQGLDASFNTEPDQLPPSEEMDNKNQMENQKMDMPTGKEQEV